MRGRSPSRTPLFGIGFRPTPRGARYFMGQHAVSIERFARNADDSWTLTAAGPRSVLTLASLSCELAVDEIDRDLDLPVRVRT